ncbi:MAG: glycosyltransferase [Marinicaulis sp.]|nr:glycosyltransferase [Marinicaulis sp.]NNL89522.1 glycosyltransferase [Marinicaulis sp.]
MKISVVIPTIDAAARLPACLNALIPAAVDGLVREVIVVDGGSSDETAKIAEAAGAKFINAPKGRGSQLAVGAKEARGEWLLFLHADTVLGEGWADEARQLIEKAKYAAGVFRLRFDSDDWRAMLIAFGARQRSRWFGAPYGDQGLLISREIYDEIGGYNEAPLFEDVDIIDRLKRQKGNGAIQQFSTYATTSSMRYERDGYFARVFGNAVLFARYRLGASPEELAKAYR